jgi:hypothetical protein
MSSAKNARRQERAERETARKRSNLVFGVVVAGVALLFVAAIALTRDSSEEPASAAPEETNSEAASSGSESILGVSSDVSLIELGHVPLNQTVEPTWTLTNTSDQAVELGAAHAEVVEGCCPGPLQFGSTSLKPGEQTQLVFPLQMHEGMDGPHEFNVHVPIASGSNEELMTLTVSGDFSA